MADIPSNRIDRPRDEHIYVSRIEKDKKGKEKFTDIPPENAKKILFASFFSYLTNLFNSFSPSKKMTGRLIDQQSIIENLRLFKELLEELAKKDLSKSNEYASDLSLIWHHLLDDYENLEIIERKNLIKIVPFRELIYTIKNYPENSEHHFGYYLLMQAGNDWLPFPFIEILSELHLNHKKHGDKSTLVSWIKMIDKAIDELELKPF